mgnify:CR=1 FL=1
MTPFSHTPDPDQPTRAKRAVFGGTFDPIHNGHLYMAGEIIRRELANEVLFVPSGHPPHKEGEVAVAPEHRLAMVSAAIEGIGEFSVSDIEVNRKEGYSYTFDTLTLLSRVFPDQDLLFVVGMDSLRDLHKWHRATELVSHFDIVTYPRFDIAPPAFTRLAQQFGAPNAARMLNAIIDCGTIPISSSEVRRHAAHMRNLAGLVPGPVLSYIRQHRLYRPHSEPTPDQPPPEEEPTES